MPRQFCAGGMFGQPWSLMQHCETFQSQFHEKKQELNPLFLFFSSGLNNGRGLIAMQNKIIRRKRSKKKFQQVINPKSDSFGRCLSFSLCIAFISPRRSSPKGGVQLIRLQDCQIFLLGGIYSIVVNHKQGKHMVRKIIMKQIEVRRN